MTRAPGGGLGPADVTPTSFAISLLEALGFPVSHDNISAVVAWENAEGGNWRNTAAFNPLNTTYGEPGATDINEQGVKAYTSWPQGLAATAATIQLPPYTGIRSALAAGNDQVAVEDAVTASPWGTRAIAPVTAHPTRKDQSAARRLGRALADIGGLVTGNPAGAAGDLAGAAGGVTGAVSGITSWLRKATLEVPITVGAVALVVWGLARATRATSPSTSSAGGPV